MNTSCDQRTQHQHAGRTREPDIYGRQDYAALVAMGSTILRQKHNITIDAWQIQQRRRHHRQNSIGGGRCLRRHRHQPRGVHALQRGDSGRAEKRSGPRGRGAPVAHRLARGVPSQVRHSSGLHRADRRFRVRQLRACTACADQQAFRLNKQQKLPVHYAIINRICTRSLVCSYICNRR